MKHGFVWWAQAVGIVCGSLIALATVLHFLGLASFSFAMSPVRSELTTMADTLRMYDRREAVERVAADDSLRHTMQGDHGAIMNELHDIHSLLIRRHP